MTNATFYESEDKHAVRIEGHAGYNPSGPDILCAACSALSCALLDAALCLEAEGGCHTEHSVDEAAGRFHLSMQAEPWALARAQGMMAVARSGFALLAREYPEHVRLALKSGEK